MLIYDEYTKIKSTKEKHIYMPSYTDCPRKVDETEISYGIQYENLRQLSSKEVKLEELKLEMAPPP